MRNPLAFLFLTLAAAATACMDDGTACTWGTSVTFGDPADTWCNPGDLPPPEGTGTTGPDPAACSAAQATMDLACDDGGEITAVCFDAAAEVLAACEGADPATACAEMPTIYGNYHWCEGARYLCKDAVCCTECNQGFAEGQAPPALNCY